MVAKVWFVGAGPGDPELITVKGLSLLRNADVLIYAGSLVNPELIAHSGAPIKLDSWGMKLEEAYRGNGGTGQVRKNSSQASFR